MIKVRVNSQRMSKTLSQLSTYANEELGKVSENLLRRIITGKGVQALPDSLGVYGRALRNAPTPQQIESDTRRLKLAYMKKDGAKKLVKVNKDNKAQILKERIKAIGFTARTLIFDWNEAKSSRSIRVSGKLDRDHDITISTIGTKALSKFVSRSKGLLKLNKKHRIVSAEIQKAKDDALTYIQQLFRNELKKLIRK